MVTKLGKCQSGEENRGPRALTFFTLCEVAVALDTHIHVEMGTAF